MVFFKEIIQAFLASRFVSPIADSVVLFVGGVFSFVRPMSIVFHWFNFFPFSREQQAVLRGQLLYIRKKRNGAKTSVYLRRNVHRIEKGLLMRPRKAVFARSYIGETVQVYGTQCAMLTSTDLDVDELRWATDVLIRYFNTVDLDNTLSKIADYFYEIRKSFEETWGESNLDRTPYCREQKNLKVTYDGLLELSKQRRSVRWFSEQKVPRELIDKALLVGREAPSACNRQPFEYRIFDDPQLVQQIVRIPFGCKGYEHNIPAVAVLVGDLSCYFSSRDRHVIYIDASLSAMGFMFALETLGLSSCVINWPDFELTELKMQRLLNLGIHERPIMLIALGYPDKEGKVAFSQKKQLNTFRSFNRM